MLVPKARLISTHFVENNTYLKYENRKFNLGFLKTTESDKNKYKEKKCIVCLFKRINSVDCA